MLVYVDGILVEEFSPHLHTRWQVSWKVNSLIKRYSPDIVTVDFHKGEIQVKLFADCDEIIEDEEGNQYLQEDSKFL